MAEPEQTPGETARPEPAVRQPQSEAAQALSAILQTQYLRYGLILSWGLALAATIGVTPAAGWLALTLFAGFVRGWFEKRVAARVGAGYGLIFPAVATATTVAWAVAPVLAWFSDAAFGKPLAMAFIVSGYLLVFTQLRSSPKQAMVISSPYWLVSVILAGSMWGT